MTRIVALLLTSCFALAQTPNTKLPGEQWSSIFNGKDLSGWVKVGNEKWMWKPAPSTGKASRKSMAISDGEEVQGLPSLPAFQVRGGRKQRRVLPHGLQARHRRRESGLQFEIDRIIGHHTGGLYGDDRQWIVWPGTRARAADTPERLE